MDEKTIIRTVDLPFGRDWEWYPESNVVALAPHLDEVGRTRALYEASVHWRRSCQRALSDWRPSSRTQPLATISPVAR